jgi:hypothetical protein
VQDHCDECGFDGRPLTLKDVSAQLRDVPAGVQALLAGSDEPSLRRRPDPTTWSAVEYLGHLRDLMAWHRFLIERAVEEVRPKVPPVDPDQSVASSGYGDADVEELTGQFVRRVERLCGRIDSLRPGEETRVVEWIGGNDIDVDLIARSALHEGFHHTGDIRRVLDQRPISAS